MRPPDEPKLDGNHEVEEAPSQALLPVAIPTLLLLCAPGPDLDAVCSAVLTSGVRPVHVPRVDLAPPAENAPAHCFIDLGLPGAVEYLKVLAKSPGQLLPVAVIASAADEAKAYRLGAVTTVRRPLSPELVLAIVSSQRQRIVAQRHSDVVVEHDRRITTANAFEELLSALGQDLRNPLATALANVEFLSELREGLGSPMTDEETKAVVEDTLSSLQRIRAAIENVIGFVPQKPPTLEKVRLWQVAQRVLDGLNLAPGLATLQGDPEVRGWCDEAALLDVTRTLVLRTLERRPADSVAKLTIHVYAHDTEARLTVHDYSQTMNEPLTGDPFHPGLTLGKPGQSGLLFAAARHAVVRMGGTLSYIPKTKAGCAFRVRLRIVQPTEP
jgi:K+-sensing histidine kinase KdpD